MAEMLEEPLFKEREMVLEVTGKDSKPSKALGVPVKLSETPGSVRTAAVEFGESTSAILTELGYSEEEIKAFEEDGVV